MTNIQINERIGKILGYYTRKASVDGVTQYSPVQWMKDGHFQWLPDFSSSLDACAEFENTLDVTESTEYAVQLRRIVTRNTEDADKHQDTLRIPDGRYYCATPIERCEAWLSFKGQWDEN